MKLNQKRGIPFVGITVFMMSALASQAQNYNQKDSVVYNSNSYQTFVVPNCVTELFIEAHGASGAHGVLNSNNPAPGKGGKGGYATGKINVTPGETLYVFVGQASTSVTGGWNGGANGGQHAGGGGGATDIRRGGLTTAERIIVAGGGGGGGASPCDFNTNQPIKGKGGNGNGQNGEDGALSNSGGPGFGGTLLVGGLEGYGCAGYLGTPGTNSLNEIGGIGGVGHTCCCGGTSSRAGGGGGGGGYQGGSGGGAGSTGTTNCSGNSKGGGGGGAGGSSYNLGMDVPLTIDSSTRFGNGIVYISYNSYGSKKIVSSDSTCKYMLNSANIGGTINLLDEFQWSSTGGIQIQSSLNSSSINYFSNSNGYLICSILDYCSQITYIDSFYVHVKQVDTATVNSPANNSLCIGENFLFTGSPAGGTFTVISGNPTDLNLNNFTPSQYHNYVLNYNVLGDSNCVLNKNVSINVNCTLSEENNELNTSVVVYPNPSKGQFNIEFGKEVSGDLKLMDITGKVVQKMKLSNHQNVQIQSKLSAGTYILLVETKTGNYKTNIVIQ